MSKNAPTVGFVSLGCPKATVDSERILTQLRMEGYQIVPSYEDADVVVVNTCGFIDSAKAESLDAIGEAIAENGKVIVTGCMGVDENNIRGVHPSVLAVTGPQQYEQVVNAVHEVVPPNIEHDPFVDLVPPQGIKLTPRHYAYLKISEGCNHSCSFCIIPSMRGKLVSRPVGDVLSEAERLVKAGVKEVLVISQDTSAYGVDLKYKLDFWNGQPVKTRMLELCEELGNLLPIQVPLATLLTQVEVDPEDPAFKQPTKPIGPVYSREEAERLAEEKGWAIAADGDRFRRVVPSPRPQRIFEIRPIGWLLEKGCVVICAGGGGIPTVYDRNGRLQGVEAVIDKDLCSALLAEQLDTDLLVIATDVDGAYLDWGTPQQRRISEAHPDQLASLAFAAGSMGPKVQAACEFARNTGNVAVIGSLEQIEAIIQGRAGTRVSLKAAGLV